jgi:carbon monoxide dehydrogenase subunit G
MIQLAGERQMAISAERLYQELGDLSRLVQTLPDVQKVKSVSEDEAAFVVKPGLSFVKGELDTVARRVEHDPPRRAVLEIASKGIGSSSKVRAAFELEPAGEGTLLRWRAEVLELGGLLKMVPAGLLKGAGQKVVESWITNLEQRLRG